MAITPDTQEKIDTTAIRAATEAVEPVLKEVRSGVNKIINVLFSIQDANNSAEANKAATRKSKTDELKKHHKGNYTPE